MGLFRISRELQFRVYDCSEPCTSPRTGREGEHIHNKGKEDGWEDYSKQRVHGFSLAESLPGKEWSLSSSFFFFN